MSIVQGMNLSLQDLPVPSSPGREDIPQAVLSPHARLPGVASGEVERHGPRDLHPICVPEVDVVDVCAVRFVLLL